MTGSEKPGSFDLTIEKNRMSEQGRNKSVIMSTVSKTNMDEIPDIIDEVVKAKSKGFCIFRVMCLLVVKLTQA